MEPIFLPKQSAAQKQGGIGLLATNVAITSTLGWIFRKLDQETDFGIDAIVEVVEEDRSVTGRMFSLQVKSGASWFKERTEAHVVFRDSIQHLHYWLRNSLPVIVAIHEPTTDEILWQRVTTTSAIQTEKGWKMLIPVNQRLDASAKTALRDIAFNPGPNYEWQEQIPALAQAALRADNPYYQLLPSFQPDGVRLGIYPRPGIEPPPIGFKFKLSLDEAAKLKRHRATGEEVTVSATLLSTENLWGLHEGPVETMLFLPAHTLDKVLRFDLVMTSGSSQSRLNFDLSCENAGHDEIVYSNFKTDAPRKMRVRFNLKEREASLKFSFTVLGVGVKAALEAWAFQRQVARGGTFSLELSDSGLEVCKWTVGEGELAETHPDLDTWISICEMLLEIQKATGILMQVPDGALSEDDLVRIQETATILREGELMLGNCEVSFPVDREMAQRMLRECDDDTQNIGFRPRQEYAVEILDQQIVLGPSMLLIENPMIDNREEAERILAETDADELVLKVRSRDGKVTHFFEKYRPKRSSGQPEPEQAENNLPLPESAPAQ